MAGRFRGAVGKLTKPKKSRTSRKMKGKRTVALVKRAPKLSQEALLQRVAELTGAANFPSASDAEGSTQTAGLKKRVKKQGPSSLCSESAARTVKKPIGRASIEIVGKTTEKVVPTKEVAVDRTSAEAMGLKLLRRAVKNQNHNRLLSHQTAHDYEYRLRSVATAGVVCLFNSLSQSRKAGKGVEEEQHLTADKVQERRQIASKEAFLAALRQPRQMDRYW